MLKSKIRRMTKDKNYYLLFNYKDTVAHQGKLQILKGQFKSLADAKKEVEELIRYAAERSHYNIQSNGWHMANDYVCQNCGEVHDVLLDYDHNLIYGYLDCIINNGKIELTVEIAKTLNDENTARVNQSMERK